MKEESAKVVGTGERIKAASKEEIVRWLASATDYIKGKPDLVRRSFKACGISNMLSGQEDSLIRKDAVETPTADSDDDAELEVDDYEDDDVPIAELISREIEKM